MEREDRYIVIKKTDLEVTAFRGGLTSGDINKLNHIVEAVQVERYIRGKDKLKAVVVESDWPEYERVWDMLSKRVDFKDRKVINPITRRGPIPGGAFELARKMSEALSVDRLNDGFDLEAGLYGSELSQLLIEMDKWRKKSEIFDIIRSLMGYVENGTDDIVTMFQDDATREYHVRVGTRGPTEKCSFGPCFSQVIIEAYNKYGEKLDG